MLRISPAITAIFLFTSLPAWGGYRECLREGGKGEARSCRGHHKGHWRHRHGRHHSHLHRILGRPANYSGRSGYTGQTAGGSARQRQGYRSMATAVTMVTAVTALRNQNQQQQQNYQPGSAAKPTVFQGAPAPGAEEEEQNETESGDVAFAPLHDVEAAVSQDIAACSGAQSSAAQCCGNPMACRGQMNSEDSRSLDAISRLIDTGPSKGGLKEYCGQMKTMSGDSRNLNSGLAGVCFEAGDSCESVCEDLAQDYAQILAECNGCEAQSVYQSALKKFQDSQRTCSSLGDKADLLADSGFDAAIHQAIAKNCTEVSASNPVADAGSTPASGNREVKAQGAAEGSKSETAKAADDETLLQKPRVEMQVDASKGFKGYAMNRAPETQRNMAGDGRSSGKSGAASVAPAAPAASKPATVAKDQKPVKPEEKKDDDPGKTADGKGRSVASEKTPHAIGNNGGQFGNEADLGQLLPAGVKTAMNRSGRTKEINDPAEDLFMRITKKIMEKCRLGVLFECSGN